jgi:hypothetical protein
MTATDVGRGASWGVGSAIGTAFSILFSHFAAFVGTALVASLPSLVFALAVPAPASRLQTIVNLIVGEIVAVTLIYGAIQVLRGRQVAVGECFSQGFRRLGTAIGVASVAGIGIAFGAVLLIVPGLILLTMWSVAIPSAVVERTGVFRSLSRSTELTRGRRWAVFGAILVASLITIVLGAVIGAVVGGVFRNAIALELAVWAITAATQAFTACLYATLYFYLRREKEGVDIEQIASVFD